MVRSLFVVVNMKTLKEREVIFLLVSVTVRHLMKPLMRKYLLKCPIRSKWRLCGRVAYSPSLQVLVSRSPTLSVFLFFLQLHKTEPLKVIVERSV